MNAPVDGGVVLDRKGLTPIEYSTEARFVRPKPPTFAVGPSLLSILSLVLMTGLSVLMLWQLVRPDGGSDLPIFGAPDVADGLATWTWLPFAFTIFGAGLGALFETYLLLTGTPFQQLRSRATARILSVRLLNLAPVAMTIFFFVVSFTIGDESLRLGLLYLAAFTATALALALFFGGAKATIPLILLGTQLVQILLVLGSDARPDGVAGFLILQAVSQSIAFIVGTATPMRSFGFHMLSTFSGVMLFRAIVHATNEDPTFSHDVALSLPLGSMRLVGLVVALLAGLVVMAKLSPGTYSGWRAAASNAVWSPIYFLLVSQPRFPDPISLRSIYGQGPAPQPTRLRPYSQQHPRYMTPALNIPAAENIETNVTAFTKVVAQARKIFTLIAPLDYRFPQANPAIPLSEKPRMDLWSDGSDYYPGLFTKKILGLTIPGRTLEPTPEPAIDAFKSGQLLAYLAESGVANPLLTPGTWHGEDAVVLDLRHLEKYEVKDEYEPYGGQAFFTLDAAAERLVLRAVVAPRDSEEHRPDPRDATFRHAEAMVLASMYFAVISGKHLCEIHMTCNLVEVAMHNAFDAQRQWAHPFRAFMYLHLFSHELAEEITTEHLVQQGGIFSQVFALTYPSLIDSLNDGYRSFDYGADEDFEGRAALMTVAGHGDPIPKACIRWELRYAELFQRYASSLIDAIYADDAAVLADTYLQDFWDQLDLVIPNDLPERYEHFRTKAGVARYASDTIFHLVIRHQVYGTTGVKAAMDPRLSSTQVPTDGGTPGVDEWRSLICVALATARARFTLLIGDFDYLLEGVDDRYVPAMTAAFDRLQEDLRILDAEWTSTERDRQFNYDYFRALPSDLHTGPGY